MSKFLVVHFDRYDAKDSTNHFVESKNSKDAFIKANKLISETDFDADEVNELKQYFNEMALKSTKIFTSLSEEESDWLIYNLDSVVQKG